ncbi:MAG: 3'-5' exoribonuclease [Ruminococcus sp.]|nr:3'-5' exoribonuclease [Ruminococcus sp.]
MDINEIKKQNYYEWQRKIGRTTDIMPYEEWILLHNLGTKFVSDEIEHINGFVYDNFFLNKKIATVGGLKYITNAEKLLSEIGGIYIKDIIPDETDIILTSNAYYNNILKKGIKGQKFVGYTGYWKNLTADYPNIIIVRESEFLRKIGYDVPFSECKGEVNKEDISNYTIIDIETTGTNTKSCEIIELAAVKVVSGLIVGEYDSLIKPTSAISKKITDLTGITNEMVENAPLIEQELQNFLDFVGDDVILGHNISTFDSSIIYRYCEALKLKPFVNDMFDTLNYAHYCDIDVPDFKLSTLCKYFGIEYDAHRAKNDCIANYKCYEELKQRHSGKYKKATVKIENPIKKAQSEISVIDEFTPVTDKQICLSGDFACGSKEEITTKLEALGATVKKAVSGKTDYLIVGKNGSDSWSCGNYGSKVKKALELQSKGKDIKIIKEEDFFKCLKTLV